MTWSQSWSGLGSIQASSVQVIGPGVAEIDLNVASPGGTFTAAMSFVDLTGNNATTGYVYGFRDAATNGMAVRIAAGPVAGGQFSSITTYPEEIQLAVSDGSGTGEITLTGAGTVFQHPIARAAPGSSTTPETWHVLPLVAGWVPISGYLFPAYRMTADNDVEFRGTFHNGTNADNTLICTLPAGYIPTANALLRPPVGPSGSGNVGSSRIFINTSGQMFIYGMTGVTDIGMDGLRFSLD